MHEFDLVVIGGGPGGYVAAIRAAQLGLKVACVEKENVLGGTCLRVGCIPSKVLLESSELYHEARTRFTGIGIQCEGVRLDLAGMMRRKDQVVSGLTRGVEGLFKKNKVHRVIGEGRLGGEGKVVVRTAEGPETELKAKHIVLATGSVSARIPGVEADGRFIGTSTEALAYESVPKHLVVIGAGYIGLELGSVWRRLGAEVTFVEFLDRILPGMDEEIAGEAFKLFEKQGLKFRLGVKVKSARLVEGGCVVETEKGEALQCDRVLVSVGRKPCTEGLGLEKAGIELDAKGRVPVNDHFATSTPGVYAIGDLIRGPMLAHKAEEEGVACVEHIVTGYGHVDYATVPGVVYTSPEIASVGKTESELREAGHDYRKGVFPFRGNGRAYSLGMVDGKVKILADKKTDRILGVHILGPRAGDLIAEAAAAMAFGASSEDIGRLCHAHPTLSEAMKEAALAVDGRAIHF